MASPPQQRIAKHLLNGVIAYGYKIQAGTEGMLFMDARRDHGHTVPVSHELPAQPDEWKDAARGTKWQQ
ncbi:MAG: hypothetical protein J0L73_01360 [Verrucomicrobia bacterium]|nr:hypothetical protein [Verrucomicrobiota bacterium]